MNCKEITNRINDIRSKKNDFDVEFANGDIDTSLKLKSELVQMIKELNKEMWSPEKLTMKEIERQHDEWTELYQNLDPKYKVPSKERIQEFLQDDPEFMKLMKTKEKQGFVKLIIAPAPGFYSLKSFTDEISQIVKSVGGNEIDFSDTWQKMLANEDNIHYFGTIENTNSTNIPTGGVTAREIKSNPDKYSVCDGWMISITTDEQNITKGSEPDKDTGNGRIAIKTSLTALRYVERYFSDSDEEYIGEKAMIPQEGFALFAKDFNEKYIKTKKSVEINSNNLFDSTTVNWFVSTYLPGRPFSSWAGFQRFVGSIVTAVIR